MKKLICISVLCLFMVKAGAQDVSSDTVKSFNLVLQTSKVKIYGTLSAPETGKKIPVVLIVPSGGNTDRDGNSLEYKIRTNAYKLIADTLNKSGIAVMRYDKRGVGESLFAADEYVLRFEDYVDDVVAWITYLRQSELFTRIIVLGHGEGSLLGMLAVGKSNADAYISVEGPGKTADDLFLNNLKGMPQPLQDEAAKILDTLKSGRTVDSVSVELQPMLHRSVQPFMISMLRYDPAKEISKLNIPVLIIHGTTDIQIPLDNARWLAKAKPEAELVIIDQMNYIFKKATEEITTNRLTYYKPEFPLHPEFVGELLKFIGL